MRQETASKVIARRWVLLAIAIVVPTVAAATYLKVKTGSVVLESQSPKGVNGPIIRIRAVPSSANVIWMFVPTHSRFYRCEYYASRNAPLLSSQSFEEDSYVADKVEVRWDGVADATILFDARAALRCRNGWWEKIALFSSPARLQK